MYNIKKISILKKIDKFFLLNYPLLWNLRFHYLIFYNFLIFCLVLGYSIFYEFEMYQILYTYQYLFPITIVIFIYWIYQHKKYISLEEYNKKLPNPISEYLLYFVTVYLVILPFAIAIIMSIRFVGEHTPKTDDFKILQYSFVDNQYEMKCSKDENGLDVFDQNSTRICIGNKKEFDEIVLSWSTKKNSEKIREEDVIDAQNTLEFFQNKSSFFHSTILDTLLSLYLPILIIFFKYSGYKKSIRIIQFAMIYGGFIGAITYFFLENMNNLAHYLSIHEDFVFISFLFIPLLLFYKIFKRHRLIFFAQIVLLSIFVLTILINTHTNIPFQFGGLVVILLTLLFIKPIRSHILYLNAKPKEKIL